MDDGFIWKAPALFSPDWTGTAQLAQQPSADLARLAGLDSDEWLIVGFDIHDNEDGHDLRVIAVHRDLMPEAAAVLPKIAEEHGGEIPATAFLVHDVEPYDVLRTLTRRFELQMRARGSRDLPIRITAVVEGPEQPHV
jgi:hypothetical protein